MPATAGPLPACANRDMLGLNKSLDAHIVEGVRNGTRMPITHVPYAVRFLIQTLPSCCWRPAWRKRQGRQCWQMEEPLCLL